MHEDRPIRFCTGGGRTSDPAKLISTARRAERLGYSTFGMADHFMMPLAPVIALQAVADATSELRLTQLVLAQDFRHPAVLAKELATLDVLSGGRLEVGMGAGWMQAEFESAGIPFDKASLRIERLEEAVAIVKGLFDEGPLTFSGEHYSIKELQGLPRPVQTPRPPIMIGGGGPKILAAAARQADIVQVLPGGRRDGGAPDPGAYSAEAYQEKIDWIRDAAPERFADIELATLLLNVTVTDDPDTALDDLVKRLGPAGAAVNRGELMSSPVVAIGSLDQVCDKLLETRKALGFTYFTSPVGSPAECLAPVIERLKDFSGPKPGYDRPETEEERGHK